MFVFPRKPKWIQKSHDKGRLDVHCMRSPHRHRPGDGLVTFLVLPFPGAQLPFRLLQRTSFVAKRPVFGEKNKGKGKFPTAYRKQGGKKNREKLFSIVSLGTENPVEMKKKKKRRANLDGFVLFPHAIFDPVVHAGKDLSRLSWGKDFFAWLSWRLILETLMQNIFG